MNRITEAISRMEIQVRRRIADGLTTAVRVAETSATLDMATDEFCRFQTLKSLSVASGGLSPGEGMTIYNLLGGSETTFNAQPVHVKAVLTGIFKKLLEGEIAR
jgi:hypothetical protein